MTLLAEVRQQRGAFKRQTLAALDGVCAPYFEHATKAAVSILREDTIRIARQNKETCATICLAFSFPKEKCDIVRVAQKTASDMGQFWNVVLSPEDQTALRRATIALQEHWYAQTSENAQAWLEIFCEYFINKLAALLKACEKDDGYKIFSSSNDYVRYRPVKNSIRVDGRRINDFSKLNPKEYWRWAATGPEDEMVCVYMNATWGEVPSEAAAQQNRFLLRCEETVPPRRPQKPAVPKKRTADADAETSEKKVKQEEEVPPMPAGAKVVKEERV